MEIRIQRIFLKISRKMNSMLPVFLFAIGLMMSNQIMAAEPDSDQNSDDDLGSIFDPKVERREVERDAINTENWEIGAYYGIISIEDFGSTEIIGARVAYHVTEDFFIESSYAEATAGLSSFERLNGNIVLLTDKQREYSYFNVALGFNFLPGEGFIGDQFAFSTSMYFLTGLGSTNFAGEQRSTIMVGAGYRVLFTDWFAWHLTLRDSFYDIELLGSAKTANDLEFSTSFTIFF
ncbi:MAG: outer membrane beta-barrel domain-containing protein [Kangiellaceae bacterium]|nr:outer membrane beta-barrel domain-containing protein [Kangiellaceae bacterium]